MSNKIEIPFVNREKIQLALDNFFDRGGKIVESEILNQDTLVKQNFTGSELKSLYPEYDYGLSKTLTRDDNLLDQKISGEKINLVNPSSECKSEETFKKS